VSQDVGHLSPESNEFKEYERSEGFSRDVEDPRADLHFGTVPQVVAHAGREFGDAQAVVERGRGPQDSVKRMSFAELADESLGSTRAAIAAGIHSGDRVGIWAPNCTGWVVAALGLLGAGAVLVPLNTRYKGPEAAYILRTAKAKMLFTLNEFLGVDYPRMLEGEDIPSLERIVLLGDEAGDLSELILTEEVPVFPWHEFLLGAEGVVESEEGVAGVSVKEHDARNRWQSLTGANLSDIIFTSGTTGRPKGAVATHAQSVRTFATWARIVGLKEGDRYLVVNPFFHTFGYKAGILACLMTGATVVPEAIFDAERLMETIESERITVLPGPPTLYQSLLDHPARREHDLSSLRLAVTGAAIVPEELVRRMGDELGFDTVLTAYGLTESTGVVTMCRQGDDPRTIATTSGRAIPGLEVGVVEGTGKELTAGEPGEVVVRGYTVTSGYFENPEATSQAIDRDGWLHTGDVGVMDERGNLTITDRLKDMFVVGGFNAYPAEIERVLSNHPEVAQVAVVGVPDARLGEVGCAFVVPAPGADEATLEADVVGWARSEMANYKVPRYVETIGVLPTNASGKVLKTELRSLFAQATEVTPGTDQEGTKERAIKGIDGQGT
jgi:HIP---CoA ligase